MTNKQLHQLLNRPNLTLAEINEANAQMTKLFLKLRKSTKRLEMKAQATLRERLT